MKQRFRPRTAPRVEWIPADYRGYGYVYVTDGVLATRMPVLPEFETREWAMRYAVAAFDDAWRHAIKSRASRMRSAYRARARRR